VTSNAGRIDDLRVTSSTTLGTSFVFDTSHPSYSIPLTPVSAGREALRPVVFGWRRLSVTIPIGAYVRLVEERGIEQRRRRWAL
jgi:hypothetical protein